MITFFSNIVGYEKSSEKNFGYLNCDCLSHIFAFLPIIDRANAGSVCKQWHLASQELWRGFKRLDVDKSKWQSGDLKEFDRVEITMFKTIMERCGQYLTEIDFTHLCTEIKCDTYMFSAWTSSFSYSDENNKSLRSRFEGIKALVANCSQIEKLSLCSLFINCDDQHLLDLFRKNKKIRYLKLVGYEIYGTCFFGLSAKVITTLLLYNCYVLSRHLCMLLERCENLNTLCLHDTLPYNMDEYGAILKLVASANIKSLREFYLGSVCDDQAEYILYQSIHVNDAFKNLIAIQIIDALDELLDNVIIAIGRNCKNLKIADFSGCWCVTDKILMHITTLPRLEVLCINALCNITDRSLIYLSEHLRVLKCITSQITDNGVVTLLNKSQNIELLDLSFCRYITNKSVNHAIDVTKYRISNVVLNMCVEDTYIKQWEIKNESPFFRLHHACTKEELSHLNIDLYDNLDLVDVSYSYAHKPIEKGLFCEIDKYRCT